MVVEITPIGIASLGWQFYIIWTVFNASFVPIVYFFYPETAARKLEDIDRFFHDHDDILIFRIPEAVASKRPAKYEDMEDDAVRRNSSVNPEAAARARSLRTSRASQGGRRFSSAVLGNGRTPGYATEKDGEKGFAGYEEYESYVPKGEMADPNNFAGKPMSTTRDVGS